MNEVRFSDVASQIDPTSVHFRSLTDPEGTVVLEQNYEYDIVGSAKLLSKYVDQEIRLVTEDGQEYVGTLLSGDRRRDPAGRRRPGDGRQAGPDQRVHLPGPARGADHQADAGLAAGIGQGETHDVEVTYLTGGVNW